MDDRYSSEHPTESRKVPEARYSYYRRCRVFRRNGEQCKAPAEKGSHICYAHAAQRAMAFRRDLERRIVLAEAVAEMRRQGRPECEMADLFTDFKGIQVTLAVMSRALIHGRIDCKTAGQMVVHLQTLSKLLWQVHRKERKDLPLIHTDDTDLKKLPKTPELQKPLLRIISDDVELKEPVPEKDCSFMVSAGCADHLPTEGGKVLPFDAMAFADRCRAHDPPEWKAA